MNLTIKKKKNYISKYKKQLILLFKCFYLLLTNFANKNID